jgi:hypothetical protein
MVDAPRPLPARAVRVEQATHLAAGHDEVAEVALTVAGVNAELRPLVAMVFPRHLRDLQIADAPVGVSVGRCWMLAGGVVPFDRHALGFASVRPPDGEGHGFVEESSSWLQARWRHERTIAPHPGGGCEVRDVVTAVPRLPGSSWLVRRIVTAIFRHRHRRLARRWGVAPASP